MTALPIFKIGDVGDWARLHPSEDDYWTRELCFVAVPIKGTKRNMLHVIDDDLAVQYLPAKKIKRHRLALACKPHDVFFFCIVPSQNLDNAWNADALKACHRAQTHWIQALSRRSEGVEGYEIKFAQIRTHFPSRNGRRVRSMSCWKSRSRTPTSTTTAIPAVAPDRGQAGSDLNVRARRRTFPPHRRPRFRI